MSAGDTSRTTSPVLRELLDGACEELSARGISEARTKAEIVVSHVLGCPRLALPLHYGDDVEQRVQDVIRYYLDEVLSGIPLQYVLGEVEFMAVRLAVDGRALIPRPETEGLVQAVLDDEKIWSNPRPVIHDVGTGSGCIVLALAHERPQAEYRATDVRPEALQLARENAVRLGLAERVAFAARDLLEGCEEDTLDAVVSNPPYVTSGEMDGLEPQVKFFEPRWALDGGGEGISVIERLVPEAFKGLKSGGRLYMEIGASQSAIVCACMEASGYSDVRVLKDLAGRDRVIRGSKP